MLIIFFRTTLEETTKFSADTAATTLQESPSQEQAVPIEPAVKYKKKKQQALRRQALKLIQKGNLSAVEVLLEEHGPSLSSYGQNFIQENLAQAYEDQKVRKRVQAEAEALHWMGQGNLEKVQTLLNGKVGLSSYIMDFIKVKFASVLFEKQDIAGVVQWAQYLEKEEDFQVAQNIYDKVSKSFLDQMHKMNSPSIQPLIETDISEVVTLGERYIPETSGKPFKGVLKRTGKKPDGRVGFIHASNRQETLEQKQEELQETYNPKKSKVNDIKALEKEMKALYAESTEEGNMKALANSALFQINKLLPHLKTSIQTKKPLSKDHQQAFQRILPLLEKAADKRKTLANRQLAQVYQMIASYHSAMGIYDRASEAKEKSDQAFENAARHEEPGAMLLQGVSALEKGNSGEAKKWFKAIVEKVNGTKSVSEETQEIRYLAQYNLAKMALRQNDKDTKAIEILKDIAESDSRLSGKASYALYKSCERLSQQAEADYYFGKAVAAAHPYASLKQWEQDPQNPLNLKHLLTVAKGGVWKANEKAHHFFIREAIRIRDLMKTGS